MTELEKLTRLNAKVLLGCASTTELRNYLIKRYSYNATNRMMARLLSGASLNDAIYAESKYYGALDDAIKSRIVAIR